MFQLFKLGKVVLCCLGLWSRNGHCCLNINLRKVLRVARRPGHHHWQWALQMRWIPVPAVILGHGNRRPTRDHLLVDHEVRHRHQKGLVCQQCAVRRHHHVPGHCWPHAEGDHRFGAEHHEDQDHCAAGAQVLCMDRRLHPGLAVNLSVDVDHQVRVWWVGTKHCSQKMLLSLD